MRKSRLSLFKSTSMLISVLGVIMIIATVAAVAYVGFSVVSSSLTGGISSGTQYDELADLKSSYSDLVMKFDNVKSTYYAGSADDIKVYEFRKRVGGLRWDLRLKICLWSRRTATRWRWSPGTADGPTRSAGF